MPRPTFRSGAVRVRVPATSANLGPGFDAFGLALGLYDDVVVTVTGQGLRIKVVGEGAGDVCYDERHLVASSMRAAFAVLGGQPPGLQIACTNRIPQARGLGSSAAAIVAGILAARALVPGGGDLMDDQAVLTLAARLEGHPDNVAACLHGGLTIAWGGELAATGDGSTRVLCLQPAAVSPVVFLPADQASTSHARAALPATVPHADAAANACRAALLIPALTGRPDLLFEATADRIHQSARAPAMPATADLVQRLRDDRIPAAVSGAGPAVLAFSQPDLASYAAAGWQVLRLAVAGGATVVGS